MVRVTPKLTHGFMEAGAASAFLLSETQRGKENDLHTFGWKKKEGQRLG